MKKNHDFQGPPQHQVQNVIQDRLQQALAFHQKGMLSAAKTIYEEILKQRPDHFDALHLLGVIACQTKNLHEAERIIGRAIKVNPNSAAAYYNRGIALKDLKRLDEALASYDKAIALKPDYAEAYNNRGNALKELKRLDEALASYDKAIALKSDYAEAYNNRGNALKELKRLDEALDSYDKAIALKPDYGSEAGTFLATLRLLFHKGIRYSTVIDVGCADGSFFLTLWRMGILAGAVPLNIDVNPLFEESLKAIKIAAGGDYYIGAITDREGEIELTTSIHPYWSSLRPADDPYWERVNKLSSATTTVSATTLDLLRKSFEPPFLLKLDVQGAEREVLRGATNTLVDTHVVICEADIADFRKIDDVLEQRGFALYDVTALKRTPDGTLGWFYPVYINRMLSHVLPKEFWNPRDNEAVIEAQVRRREATLKWNAEVISQILNHRRRRS